MADSDPEMQGGRRRVKKTTSKKRSRGGGYDDANQRLADIQASQRAGALIDLRPTNVTGGTRNTGGTGDNLYDNIKDTIAQVINNQKGGNLLDNITNAVTKVVDNTIQGGNYKTRSRVSKGGYCGSSMSSTQQGGKKKPSEYNLFMKKRMGEMKKTHPKLSAPEKMKIIGAEWKKKSDK